MEKGIIRKLTKNLSADLIRAEEYFIGEAENNTEKYIEIYKNLPSSANGNYICSDLFKETFNMYTENIDSRKRYAEVIHNSAAVLANELFHRQIKCQEIKKCVFVSGIPGAGKSFFIQSLLLSGEFDSDTLIYEGDITSSFICEKIDAVINHNITPYIMIVNPTLELAQRNAIMRHYEIGRGASCETMARIMSKIPIALSEIHKKYPSIELGIYNKSTNYEIEIYTGFENIKLLDYGDYNDILNKLQELRTIILQEMQYKQNEICEVTKSECQKKR